MGTLTKLFSSDVGTMKSQVEAKLGGEEVIAAGQLRQGHKPSLASMITGTALIELARPRRSKSVPKGFVLAVTPSRVLAFACTGVADDEDGENYRVVVRKQHGSWPREGVPGGGPGSDEIWVSLSPSCAARGRLKELRAHSSMFSQIFSTAY